MSNEQNQPTGIPTPEQVVEWCAKELEWMSRGFEAMAALTLHAAASRLRQEGPKIVRRAAGEKT